MKYIYIYIKQYCCLPPKLLFFFFIFENEPLNLKLQGQMSANQEADGPTCSLLYSWPVTCGVPLDNGSVQTWASGSCKHLPTAIFVKSFLGFVLFSWVMNLQEVSTTVGESEQALRWWKEFNQTEHQFKGATTCPFSTGLFQLFPQVDWRGGSRTMQHSRKVWNNMVYIFHREKASEQY